MDATVRLSYWTLRYLLAAIPASPARWVASLTWPARTPSTLAVMVAPSNVRVSVCHVVVPRVATVPLASVVWVGVVSLLMIDQLPVSLTRNRYALVLAGLWRY